MAAPEIFYNGAKSKPKLKTPLTTANIILSILIIDYPIDKVSCYTSDNIREKERVTDGLQLHNCWIGLRFFLNS